MALPSSTAIANMGFTAEMFGLKDRTELAGLIKPIITEQAALLSGRVGAITYAITAEPVAIYVSRAIKLLTAAELCQIRINRISQDARNEDGKDANKLRKNRADYLAAVDLLVDDIKEAAGGSDGFATAAVITSHFAEDA